MHHEVVEILLVQAPFRRKTFVSAQNQDGISALHLAVRNNDIRITRMLIDAEAMISAEDNDGRTAMHLAAEYGYIDSVKILKEANANFSV